MRRIADSRHWASSFSRGFRIVGSSAPFCMPELGFSGLCRNALGLSHTVAQQIEVSKSGLTTAQLTDGECRKATKTSNGKKVLVAISGGVDSAVAAHLLKKEGYNVFGVFMRNWSEAEEQGSGNCSLDRDFLDAARVCKHLNIPMYQADFIADYWHKVFQPFLDQICRGLTPNPDLPCNRHIKFNALLDFAAKMGAEKVATGHYARLERSADGSMRLLRAKDEEKDQTYFLASVQASAFNNVLFPLGGMKKEYVRALAEEEGLHVASRKSSTGICFIGRRNFAEFVEGYTEAIPGKFVDVESEEEVGVCSNMLAITGGQRAGIGGQKDKMFVVGKDIPGKKVYVASGGDHPALLTHQALLGAPTWISREAADELRYHGFLKCSFKSRYREPLQGCFIKLVKGPCGIAKSRFVTLADEDNPKPGEVNLMVYMPELGRSITPQQSFVLYDMHQEICLGSAPVIFPGITLWEEEHTEKRGSAQASCDPEPLEFY